MPINGVALSAVGIGGVFVWAGISGKSVLATVQAAVQGVSPRTLPQTNPITGTSSGAAPSAPADGGGAAGLVAISGSGHQAQIANALRGAGANNFAIAGGLGNIQVESGFNPAIVNSREGAIGFVQWEGDRRVRLQAFAAAHGGKESDAAIQISFMLQEGPPIQAMNSSGSAANAAAIWDEVYERSAGTTRSERIAAANRFYLLLAGGKL